MQQFKRQFVVFLLITLFGIQSSYPEVPLGQIDELMNGATKPNEPGAVLLVVKDGKTVMRKGYGMADMELAVPMNPDLVFRLGSITKQFTAVATLMLMERGKLALDDEITKYLPDFPVKGKRITIRHLLTHTSGIKSYTGMPEWLSLWRKDMTLKDLIDLFKDQPMDFEPDQKWWYNNSGYILLGAIIEKTSGKSYEEFIQQEIFDPLNMKNSYYGSATRIIPKRIPGYSKGKSGYENAAYLSMTQPYAAGSLLSTVDDLALWDAALYTEKLVKQSSLKQAWTPYVLANGKNTGYGFGWAVGEFQGHPMITHGGGINGFLTDAIRMPEDRLYIAILSNNETLNPSPLVVKIAGLCIGKPIVDPVEIKLPPDYLAKFVGVYEIEPNDERYIFKEGDKLYSQRKGGTKYEFLPYSKTEFFIKEPLSRFRFDLDSKGNVTGMERLEYIQYGPKEISRKVDRPLPKERQSIPLNPDSLDQYTGDYEIAPGLLMTITREGTSLFAQMTGQEKLEIFPETETVFFLKVVDADIEFIRDSSGKITSLILKQAGQEMKGIRK